MEKINKNLTREEGLLKRYLFRVQHFNNYTNLIPVVALFHELKHCNKEYLEETLRAARKMEQDLFSRGILPSIVQHEDYDRFYNVDTDIQRIQYYIFLLLQRIKFFKDSDYHPLGIDKSLYENCKSW